MSYMNESAWPGPDAAGNEAEDSGVIQATPENEAADTSGVQNASEELRPAEEGASVAGQEQTAAVVPEADTTEPSGTKPARKRGGKKKQEEPAEGDAVLGESGGETSPGRRLTAQRLSRTPAWSRMARRLAAPKGRPGRLPGRGRRKAAGPRRR